VTASRRFPFPLPIALVAALPGTYLGAATYLGLPHPELVPPLAALVYGIAIIGAAFVLSWAAEAAQVDISAGLALAVLALLAVLPEYAVDFVFSFQAGQIYAAEGNCPPAEDGSTPCALALANMTGANRVLVGVGWPLVVAVATLAVRRSRRHGGGDRRPRQPRGSSTSSMSTPPVDFGCTKATRLPRMPIRGVSSISATPDSFSEASVASMSVTA